jgi:alkyl sulfatase BDS1-like metallo-beta-lactamase superfamily hydrolase
MESHPAADDVMTAFRRYSQKPVIALIYTHFHHDHVGGSYAYLKYTVNNSCEVYAHELTASILAQFMGKTGSIGQIRAARQFGNYLPPEEFINSGIGPCLHFNPDCELSILSPSVTFSKELSLTLDGISLRLLHCPGETDDQIVIHVVDKDLLCAADNIYRAFPNLYAIRGTPSRDAYVWAHSLNVMASLNVTHLVPSHTQPITGRDAVREVLSVYRDAVLFVHDQTVRYMNKGYFLDDIVTQVRLPPHLIDHPYLQVPFSPLPYESCALLFLSTFPTVLLGPTQPLPPLPPPSFLL